MLLTALLVLALIGWLYLAFANGKFWQILLDDGPLPQPTSWPSVDIITPARNEADMVPHGLASLLAQDYPGALRVILVDDHSTDGTGEIARQTAAQLNASERLTVIQAPGLPAGWSGKVAAMHAGVQQGSGDYILFTDADIKHDKTSLRRLVARSLAQNLDLNSLMVRLNCTSLAEKLLIPAFVFFFAMLYPFRRANNPASNVAAAAGGVMLVRRATLQGCGGMNAIKGALIDDCALASVIKSHGGRIRLSLTNSVISLRPYPAFANVWNMVARTAFTQLNYSTPILVGAVLGLLLLFVAPVLASLIGGPLALSAGIAAWIVMTAIYLPMVRFYAQPPVWALTLPLAALIYIAATIDSARRYWQGKGGQWKNRNQAQ